LSETGLAEIVDKMLAKTALSDEDKAAVKRAEHGKPRIVEKYRTRIDQQFQRAIALLTDKQLFTVVLRRESYETELKSVQKIRTASAEEWPQVRERLADRITSDEYWRVHSEASIEWERVTGKRTDTEGGAGFTPKTAGIEDELKAILQSGRDYLDNVRKAGAPENRLNQIAAILLKHSVQVVRTWPPNDDDWLNLRISGVPIIELMRNEGKGRASPYNRSRLMEEFLTKVLMTPGAAQTLEKLGRAG